MARAFRNTFTIKKAARRRGPGRLPRPMGADTRWRLACGSRMVRRDRLKGLVGLDTSGDMPGGIKVTEAVTINRPIEDVYAFWRDFTNLPLFMEHLESVTTANGRSH